MTDMRKRLATVALLGALLAPLYVHADPCKLEISGNDQMQYDRHELWVSDACTEVTLTLHHSGKLPKEAMGHNWVLVNGPDLDAVANAGMNAGLPNNYVAAGDQRVLAHTKVVGGGETTRRDQPCWLHRRKTQVSNGARPGAPAVSATPKVRGGA